MRDSAISGAVAGLAGGIVYLVFTWLYWAVGISKVTLLYLGAYMMVRPGVNINTFPAQALGFVQHFALSLLLGLVVVYMLRVTGRDYLWVKGIIFGGAIYLLIYGVIAKLVIPAGILQPDVSTSIVYLFGHILFGLTSVYVAGYYMGVRRFVK